MGEPQASDDALRDGAMPVLSLRQPWASLVALGVKTIETRSWSTRHRGPLAIQAAAKRTVDTVVGDWKVFDAGLRPGRLVMEHYGTVGQLVLPLGAIVATCTLVEVVPILDVQEPWPKGDGGRAHMLGDDLLVYSTADIEWPTGQADQLPYGDYRPGRFAWLLADVEPLAVPVAFKGGQGLTKRWCPAVSDYAVSGAKEEE